MRKSITTNLRKLAREHKLKYYPEPGRIYSPHSYNNFIVNRLLNPKLTHIGYEIEIEHEKGKDYLVNSLDYNLINRKTAWLESDGSLRDGIEIVSIPTELQCLSYVKLYKIIKSIAKTGATAHNNSRCGLHIHISRNALTSKKWAQLRNFVYTHRNLFQDLSRRKIGNENGDAFYYCKFIKSPNKYRAINFMHHNTVEFRLWRSTLKPSSFLSSFDITISLVKYFQNMQTKNASFPAYLKHCKKNHKLAYGYMHQQAVNYWNSKKPRKLTIDQKIEKIAKRNQRKAEKHRLLIQEINSYINRANRPIIWDSFSQFYGNLTSVDKITKKLVPVKLSGFRREVRKFLEQNYTPLTAIATISPSASQRLKVRRTYAYGRERLYINLESIN